MWTSDLQKGNFSPTEKNVFYSHNKTTIDVNSIFLKTIYNKKGDAFYGKTRFIID